MASDCSGLCRDRCAAIGEGYRLPYLLLDFSFRVAATQATSVVPCPLRCTCSLGRGGNDCGKTVVCKGLRAFPLGKQYPDGLDCLFINSPKLKFLSAEELELGLLSIPSSVRRLDLSESRLGQIPEVGLGHLYNLRVLNLEFNELTALPEAAFRGLSHLKVLWLTGNHYAPDELDYRKMQLAGNKIEELLENQFEGLDSLQVLLLHHNKLEKLPTNVFKGLTRLRVLKLLDNPFGASVTRKHRAFASLLSAGVLQQLDLEKDSGDTLEDFWEETGTYLSDAFSAGPLPNAKSREDL